MGCALKIADRILVLDNGRILDHAPVSEIKMSTKPLIREFLLDVSLDVIPS